MRLKDLGAATKFIKSMSFVTSNELVPSLVATAVSEGKLTVEQGKLVESLLATTAAEGTTAGATSSLGLAFEGLNATLAANPWIAIVAGIAAAVVAIKRIDKAIDDNRAKIIAHGKDVATQHKDAQELYKDFLDVDSAYKNGTTSKEDLIIATDKLLESLGLERWQVQGLTDDYEKLNDKMKDLMLSTLASDQYDLLESVNAAYKTYNKESKKTSADYSYRSGELVLGGDKATSRLIEEMIERGLASTDIGGNLRKNLMGQWVIDLGFDNSTIENAISQHRELVELKENLSKIATDIGMTDDFTKSGAWVQVTDMLDSTSDSWKDLNDSVKSYNEGIAQYLFIENNTIPKTAEEYAKLREKLLSSDRYKGDQRDAEAAVDTILSLIPNASELAGNTANQKTQSGSVIVKTNKEFEKFKKNIKSLRTDIVKALGEGKTLSDEQNEVFKKWGESLGYTKEQLEEVYKLFQMMYKETPPETITAKTVGDRLRAARDGIQEEQELLARTQFGNIDMTNRQELEWTEENLEKYKDALASFKLPVDEMAGEISTVLGGWDEFVDGGVKIPIAFSPLLQTESGEPELLTDEVIHKYINTLIQKADEEAKDLGEDGWTNDMLFRLDTKGIEIDGKQVKGVIAAVGDEAERVAEIMHFVGGGGGITPAVKEFLDAYESASAFAHYYILDDIGDLLTLQDEIKKAGVAWEEYQKILAGGDPEDLASNMTDALEKALKDIELGRIDAPSVWGAAKLLFSDEKLANELGYDLNRIAAELNSGFIKALFGKPEDEDEVADYAARISNYLIENANRMKSVDLISDKTTGGFKFMYSSLKELANDMGLTEEATTALLKALDAYGVEMMHSSEETRQYIQDYQSLIRELGLSAADALDALVREMAEQDVWEPHALQALQELRDAGVISGDDSEFIDMIKRVYQEVEEADRKEAHPEVFLDGVQTVETQARNLWETLKGIFESEKLQATVELNDQTGSGGSGSGTDSGEDGNAHAAGTRNAPGGIALVNELGPELISDNGIAFIANHGKPGFVNLTKGAVVFNAEETKEIFKHGYSDVPVKAYAGGTNRNSIRDRLIAGAYTKAHRQVKGTDAVGGGTKNYKTCPNCGAMCSIGTTVCGQCGYNFSTGKMDNDKYVPYVPDTSSTPTQPSTGYYYHNCANCGREISSADNRCPYCGKDPWNVETTHVDSGYYYHNCANCGKSISSRDTVCPYCGKDPWNAVAKVDSSHSLVPGNPNRSTTKAGGSSGYTGGSSGYTGDGGGNYVGDADYGSQAEPEKVDWIAVAINRVQKAIADLEKVASSGFKKLSTRLNAAKKQVGELTKEIQLQEKGYDRYMDEANGVGLSEDIARLVRDGTIDIREYDEETRELIDAYSEWYQKARDCKSAIEELHQEVADLYMDMFNNTQTDFENKLSEIEHNATMVNKGIEMSKAKGYIDSTAFYSELSGIEQQRIAMLNEELDALTKAFQEAMDSGEIEEGSEAWYEMRAAILSVEEAIADANVQLAEYEKTMRSIEWSHFDFGMERFGQLQQEANFLIELMSNDKLFEKNGQMTDRGNATMGLRVMNYNAYMKQADAYAKEMNRISKELAQNPHDTELIKRREELLGLQQQSIIAAENEKNAIKDLVANGIQLELSNLKELIDEYNESMDSAKSLYDYQKSITDKAETVAKLQKQVIAYRGDNSEENIARMQKLNEELKKAQEDLVETEMDHNISERKKLLDEMYNDYERYLNERLDDIETLVQEEISAVNASASDIEHELHSAADEVGYTITDGMQSILAEGMYSYYDEMFTDVTSINGYLESIEKQVAELVSAANSAAASAIASSKVSSVDSVKSSTPGNSDSDIIIEGVLEELIEEPSSWGSYGRGQRVGTKGYTLQVSEAEAMDELQRVRYANAINKVGGLIGDRNDGQWMTLDALLESLKATHPDSFRKLFGYSSGGLADYTGPAILHGSKDKPELVLNADDTEKFLAAAKLMRTPVLNALLDKSFRLPEIGGGIGGGITIENFAVDFNLENVSSYDDILRQAQADKRFERLITSITSDAYITGKSRLSKFRQKI